MAMITHDLGRRNLVADIRGLRVELRRKSQFTTVIKGIDLEIASGEIVALVGESGSGKSVLGMTILGLLPQTATPKISGVADILGVDMTVATHNKLVDLRRNHLGAVFQDPMSSLNPSMKISAQLKEVTKQRRAAVDALVAVGISNPDDILARYPFELSGGQRQRVMIAMALAKSPSLVVVDEPTTALDVTVQAQILRLIRDLRDRIGTAFLFVTHDLGVASEIADRVVVMLSGRVLESGSTEEIMSRAAHPYTRSLLRSRITMNQNKSLRISGKESIGFTVPIDAQACPWVEQCEFRLDVCEKEFPDTQNIADNWVSFCHNPLASIEPLANTRVSVKSNVDILNLPASSATVESVALEVIALEKTFVSRVGSAKREFTALKNVDLKVERGECAAIVGESGSGKSTLLRIIGGLESATSGSVIKMGGLPPRMVYQDAGSSLTPWMTVEELLGESLLGKRLNRSEVQGRVREVISLVHLPPVVAKARTASLSGGQRQRVAIARCVIDPPAVLLCDEPTSALDASLVGNTLNLLNDLKHDLNMAIVFVTHDLAVARYISDRILVMYKGRVVEAGGAHELCEDPLHPYTKMLLSSLPGTKTNLGSTPAETILDVGETRGCPFAPRCPDKVDVCVTTPVAMSYFDNGRRASCHLLSVGAKK